MLFVLEAPARAPGFAGVKKSIFRLRSLRVTNVAVGVGSSSQAPPRIAGRKPSARASIALLVLISSVAGRPGALRCRRRESTSWVLARRAHLAPVVAVGEEGVSADQKTSGSEESISLSCRTI